MATKLHDKSRKKSALRSRRHTKKQARGVRINYIAIDIVGAVSVDSPGEIPDEAGTCIACGTVNLPEEAISGESADECTLRGM
jgi:hypothetical protein